MRWAAIKVTAEGPDAMAAAEQLLLNAGFKGIAIEDAAIPANVIGYMPEDDRLPSKINSVQAALGLLPSIGIEGVSNSADVKYVDEEDWANAWKKYFKPIRIGKRLIVTPPWESPTLAPDDVTIVIDPGMAFGTGSHGTTQLCLEAIEQSVFPGATVADIGTGSGILAIAAAKLGASKVTATDIDPLAVRIAGENAVINGAAVSVGEGFPVSETFDVVVANILADTLIQMSEALTGLVAVKGTLIVSGIITGRQHDVDAAFVAQGFAHGDIRTSGEWVAIVYKRSDH